MVIMTNRNAYRGWLGLFLVALVVLAGCQASPPTEAYIEGLRKRAEQGSAAAQVRMGGLYLSGEGVPEDYEEAAKWLRKAAEQGNAQAQEGLGRMCYLAVVIRREAAVEAALKEMGQRLRELRREAEGYSSSGIRRPRAPGTGEWLECDVVEAYAWLSLAVVQGRGTAKEKKEAIIEQMTGMEIIQAQQLAAELYKRIESSKSE